MYNSNRFTKNDFEGRMSDPYLLYENNNVNNVKSTYMTGSFSKNKLSDLYYSQSNIDLLQELIIKGIYKKTKTKIVKQSEDELLIIMKSIYLQYCKHQTNNIQEQIHDLNKKVLDYCIPNIESGLKQYNSYIDDITKPQFVMNMPESVDIKGEKTLMPRHFI